MAAGVNGRTEVSKPRLGGGYSESLRITAEEANGSARRSLSLSAGRVEGRRTAKALGRKAPTCAIEVPPREFDAERCSALVADRHFYCLEMAVLGLCAYCPLPILSAKTNFRARGPADPDETVNPTMQSASWGALRQFLQRCGSRSRCSHRLGTMVPAACVDP